MFCPKCGVEMGPKTKFCASCGASLDTSREGVNRPAHSRPGRFHRFTLVALMMWTSLVAGLVVASSLIVGNPQANPGAVLGWTLGAGVMIVAWACGAIVLGILAIATKPSPSVPWPRSTKWLSAGLAGLVFVWPVSSARQVFSPGQSPSISPTRSPRVAGDGWQVERTTSPMDGSKTITLTLPSENQVQAWLEQETPTLVIRCQERKTEVYIVTGTAASVEYGTGTHTVRLRFDRANPVTEHWSASTDDKGLFAPSGRQLAGHLAKTDTLTFEFTPFDESPAVARFNLKGIAEHIGEVGQACEWTPKRQE